MSPQAPEAQRGGPLALYIPLDGTLLILDSLIQDHTKVSAMVSSRHHGPPRLTVVALFVVCLCSGWLQLAAPMSTEGQLALQTQQSQDFSGKACIEGVRYGKRR